MTPQEKGSHSAAFSVSEPPFGGGTKLGQISAAPLPGLAASAASRLPRWAIIGLLLLYIVDGLFGRDPWRGEDLLGLGLARSAAEALVSGQYSSLLLPQLSGVPWTEGGPLWPLILGIFMLPAYLWASLSGAPLPVSLIDDLSRVALALAMLLGLTALWKAADRFARRREAQPIDPLGLGPRSQDFGKTLGDCTLLLLLSCLGVIYPWHQLGQEAVIFLLQGLALWSLATAPERPKRSAIQCGLILAAMLLTQGAGLALAWAAAILLIFWWLPAYRIVAADFLKPWALMFLGLVFAWVLASVSLHSLEGTLIWWSSQFQNWTLLRILSAEPNSLGRLSSWFDEALWRWWPLWPIAIFGLWKNRSASLRRAPHWAVPLLLVVVIIVFGVLGPASWELQKFAPVIPLALIAAFSLLSLPRVAASLIDWFAVVLFTGLGIFIWLYWLALNFGLPTAFANRLPEVVRDLSGPAIHLHEILIGSLVTAAWIALVIWRIGRGQPRLWRPVVLSAGGLTLVWGLLMTLWLPAIDRLQGQGAVAAGLNQAWLHSAQQRFGAELPKATLMAQPNACIRVSAEHRAIHLFALGHLPMKIRIHEDACIWRLVPERHSHQFALVEPQDTEPPMEWKVIWQNDPRVNRVNRDPFLLLERIGQ
jgi:hypothetical protein